MDQIRFIPTRVGNTKQNKTLIFLYVVHPHSRGEHSKSTTLPLIIFGSSPLAWGTRFMQKTKKDNSRFIPTRVGNTEYAATAYYDIAVHPHSRGEHCFNQRNFSLIRGSSPLAWGTLPITDIVVATLRFIPTRVGNTLFFSSQI